MIEVIFSHGGTIDKFIGDAIMVIFGAPVRVESRSQIDSAARCALAMHAKLECLSDAWAHEGLPRVRMRIGIHQGTALVGNFGNERRSDFTAIGETVNLASRIERACEPGDVYLSKDAAANLSEGASSPAGLHTLKGIGDAVPLYRLTPSFFALHRVALSAPYVAEHQV
jgi:class 3 adenylate cyclase